MRILIDEPKRRVNLLKHGMDVVDVVRFDWRGCLIIDARERRSKAIGGLSETVVVIIFRRLGSEGLSIVSMRPASQKERRLYEHHQKP